MRGRGQYLPRNEGDDRDDEFEEVETWLHDEVAAFGSVGELARFLGAVVLGGHMERLPEQERGAFAAAVAKKVTAVDGRPALNYVRLNIAARKSA